VREWGFGTRIITGRNFPEQPNVREKPNKARIVVFVKDIDRHCIFGPDKAFRKTFRLSHERSAARELGPDPAITGEDLMEYFPRDQHIITSEASSRMSLDKIVTFRISGSQGTSHEPHLRHLTNRRPCRKCKLFAWYSIFRHPKRLELSHARTSGRNRAFSLVIC